MDLGAAFLQRLPELAGTPHHLGHHLAMIEPAQLAVEDPIAALAAVATPLDADELAEDVPIRPAHPALARLAPSPARDAPLARRTRIIRHRPPPGRHSIMPIRHPSSCRVNRGEYFDALAIRRTPDGTDPADYDAEGAPDESVDQPVLATLAVNVKTMQTSTVTREESGTDGATPFGLTRYEIRFAPPTGDALAAVLAIRAGTLLDWTANASGDLDAPVTLAADGPARPPHDLGSDWQLSASARA
jgi:hypothetical protein